MSNAPAAQPEDLHHEVGVTDLFFSTTDARGVIDKANSVFVRLSRHSREELAGAPHNIIRHPVMPAGAFLVMWDMLQNGDPFAAYVHNLAADGSRYDVFATITPLDDGYLSVRMRPTRTDVFAVVDTLYDQARTVEQQALARGSTRREAAIQGAAALAQGLAESGMASYTDFQRLALPAEMSSLEAHGFHLPERPGAQGVLADVLLDVVEIQRELDEWMRDLTRLGELVNSLQESRTRLSESVATSGEVAARIDAVAADLKATHQSSMSALLMPLQLWSSMEREIADHLTGLLGVLADLQDRSAESRFWIALTRLHTAMVGQFTAELIDGIDQGGQAAESIALLCRALQQGMDSMETQSSERLAFTAQTTDLVEETAGLMTIPRDLIVAWQQTAALKDLPDEVAELVPALTKAVGDAGEAMADLTQLSAQCQELAVEHDTRVLRTLIDGIAEDAHSPSVNGVEG